MNFMNFMCSWQEQYLTSERNIFSLPRNNLYVLLRLKI